MSARGPRYGRRLLSSLLTVTLQTETGGANSRTAHGQAQGVLRRIHGWQEGIWDMVSRPSTMVSCSSTMVSHPRTWVQQQHTHQPTMSRGTLVPTAGCHILTSHTFSTELYPPYGGGSCTHCCTFHSSAHGAQRGGEKQQADQRGGEKPQPDQRGGEKPQADQEDQREAEEDEEDLVERYRNLTLFQRFKMMVKDYGHVLIPVHVATSLVWFGTFYYMAISGVDPVPLLEKIGLPHSWVETMKKSGASDLMVAYAFYKIATPARYTVTLGGTTFTIRYLRKKGVMHKPPPSKHMEKMKGFIQEKRGQMKSK
ncbi:protein FAM210A-like isoform X2 [Branchiostoma floridae]|uniref:Protein FAM210A-like isoform X2 n=1 Tax=Branchiostoma floridae TaxID=7739 RepID=A0A9J7MUM8_BRAFL|nr:protein FAM210A-like isoform X2 [Branchiostoma floridae]